LARRYAGIGMVTVAIMAGITNCSAAITLTAGDREHTVGVLETRAAHGSIIDYFPGHGDGRRFVADDPAMMEGLSSALAETAEQFFAPHRSHFA
jgi:hypothetical protein